MEKWEEENNLLIEKLCFLRKIKCLTFKEIGKQLDYSESWCSVNYKKYNRNFTKQYLIKIFEKHEIPKNKKKIEIKEPIDTIYILQNGNTNTYKIGYTIDIDKRIKELQTGCSYDLKIIKLFQNKPKTSKNYRELEKKFHNCFSKERIRTNGEWFELKEQDINFIKSINSNDFSKIEIELLKEQIKRTR